MVSSLQIFRLKTFYTFIIIPCVAKFMKLTIECKFRHISVITGNWYTKKSICNLWSCLLYVWCQYWSVSVAETQWICCSVLTCIDNMPVGICVFASFVRALLNQFQASLYETAVTNVCVIKNNGIRIITCDGNILFPYWKILTFSVKFGNFSTSLVVLIV
jgi:hypothetical protein